MTDPRRSHPVLLGLIALLLLADGALLGAFVTRRLARERGAAAEHGGPDWTRLSQTDLRIAGAFGALEREGLAASLDALESAAAEDSAVLRDGHQLSHALGRQAVVGRDGSVSVISECRPIFASGCYHGVVEASLQVQRQLDMTELERMCAGAGSEDQPGPIVECVHGLGHGVVGAVGFDIERALDHCDALLRVSFHAACHSGAFMEAINSTFRASALGSTAHGGSHPNGAHAGHRVSPARLLSVDRTNPYSPCDRFDDPYAATCWMYQGLLILRHHGFKPAEALRTCDGAPDGRAGRCYESIGHQLTGLFQRDEPWIIAQCATGRADLAPHCAAGAALALAAMDWSGGRAARFCAASPVGWKDACYRAAADMLTVLASVAQRTTLCASVEPEYVTACREAAALDLGE